MNRWLLSIGTACAIVLGLPAAAALAQGAPLKGTVLETKDAAGYTYLRLKTAQGETWAAVEQARLAPGAEVTVHNPSEMRNFESKSLGRKFDRIIFGSLAPAGAAGGDPHQGMLKPAAIPAPATNVKVARAPGPDGRTVAEIHGKRAQLKGKPVVVRGTVVKVNAGIMGKNWIHLRDGSGAEKDGSNDLLVLTLEETQVGAVVVAKGTVRTDAEFGGGYAYKVLVEDAKLQK